MWRTARSVAVALARAGIRKKMPISMKPNPVFPFPTWDCRFSRGTIDTPTRDGGRSDSPLRVGEGIGERSFDRLTPTSNHSSSLPRHTAEPGDLNPRAVARRPRNDAPQKHDFAFPLTHSD